MRIPPARLSHAELASRAEAGGARNVWDSLLCSLVSVDGRTDHLKRVGSTQGRGPPTVIMHLAGCVALVRKSERRQRGGLNILCSSAVLGWPPQGVASSAGVLGWTPRNRWLGGPPLALLTPRHPRVSCCAAPPAPQPQNVDHTASEGHSAGLPVFRCGGWLAGRSDDGGGTAAAAACGLRVLQ